MGGGSRRQGEEQGWKKGKNTFRGHPCWRVHTTRTLEGELSICHAYSGCHVLINLEMNHISLLLVQYLASQSINSVVCWRNGSNKLKSSSSFWLLIRLWSKTVKQFLTMTCLLLR